MRIKRNAVLGRWEMAESDSGAPASFRAAPDITPFDKSAMLIVDDEASVRNIFKKVIATHSKHMGIDLACNGREAVEKFMARHYCVIILDLAMPIMDGFTAFQKIIEHCEAEKWQVPSVVFCTGYDPPSGVRSLVADNPLHCLLCKPVSNTVLVDSLKKRIPPAKQV